LGSEGILDPAENRATISRSPSLYPSYTDWARRLSWQNALRALVKFSVAPQLSCDPGCFQSVRCPAASWAPGAWFGCRTSKFLLAVANGQCYRRRRRELHWATRTGFLVIRQLEREADLILSSAEITK